MEIRRGPISRFKSWFRNATIGEKVMVVLDAIGVGVSLCCAYKVSKVNNEVNIDRMRLTLEGDKGLMDVITARRLEIETQNGDINVGLIKEEEYDHGPETER